MYWIVEHLLVVTVLMLMLAVITVLGIFWLVPKIYRHATLIPQFAGAAASMVIAVLFSVVLSNWYALSRDRDNRLRALRDQHYGQLRPVLRNESAKLRGLATLIAKQGHISKAGKYYGGAFDDPSAALWPDVMSHDLQQHFDDYDSSKKRLLSLIDLQDKEFRELLNVVERRIKPASALVPYWKELASLSFIEECLGNGGGIKLRVFKEGYFFEYLGGSVGGSGGGAQPPRPSPDQVAGFRAFQSLHLDPPLTTKCHNLKSRAEDLQHSAENLAKEALLLAEGTILKGTCEFIKTNSLPD
jgi:hypothetical protein